jgi:integrase
MADMTNLKKLGPKHWQVRFRFKDPLTGKLKTYKKRLQCSLDEARAHRDAAKVAVKQQGIDQPDARFSDFVETYLAERMRGRGGKKLRTSTIEKDAARLDLHILPLCGEWLVHRISSADVDQLLDAWLERTKKNGKAYSNATVNNWMDTTRLYARHVYRRLGISPSPFEALESLPPQSKSQTALSRKELQLFLDAVEEHYPQHYAMVLVGVTTGARHGEVTALEWTDIEGDVIVFRRRQDQGDVAAGTKTGKVVRAPLLPWVKEALDEHRADMLADQHPGLSTGLIFPAYIDPQKSAYNGYRGASSTRKWMHRACKLAGVPRISFHGLRHTLNTLLLETGTSEALVQSITGHSTNHMTLHYAHISDEAKRNVVDAAWQGFGD